MRTGIEHAPRPQRVRPLQRAGALDVEREHATHAAGGELGRLATRAAERLGAHDLERQLLELPAAGPRITRVRKHADVGRDVVDLGRPGQHVTRDIEGRRGVGFDQRRDLRVQRTVRSIRRGHVD